jgi:hypothetical protein
VARAEPIYFKVRSQTEAGLVAYLAAMPNGPHAKDALDALMLKRNLARRDALMERATRAMLLQVEAEDKGRRRAASLVEWWLRALLDPAPWHGTFADAPGELLARFRLSAHVPECTVADDGAQHCKKTIEQSYRVRGDKGEVERTLAMTIEVWLDQGYRLLRVKLTGPELALRTHEASSGEARSVDAKQSRDAWRALGERLNAAIIDDNRICSGGEDRASVLTLRCEEPNLVVRLAAGVAGALDSLVIERASSSSLGR